MKTIVLKISNAGAFWNDDDGLSWSATNLPAEAFRFRDQEVVFWEVALQGYNAMRGQLLVRVVDYWEAADHFDGALAPKQAVRSIVFAPLDEQSFKAQLSYYQQGALAPFWESDAAATPSIAPAAAPTKMIVDTASAHAVKFKYPILDLTFQDGAVTGEAVLPGVSEALPFQIANAHLLAEFDEIKPFFVKALARKLIVVNATLVFTGKEDPSLRGASSPQISRIDDKMLQVFRARSLRQLLSPAATQQTDKSLFTPEEFFAGIADETPAKAVLPQDGAELLAEILRVKKVRNARQLTYLADRLHRPEAPLRYVVSPNFGFVFLAEGQDGNHFILELLDSNATYIWSIPKSWETLDVQYRAVEREIQTIALFGRNQYRRSLQFEHEFWHLRHQHAASTLVDGFPKWRSRLEEGLV